MPGVVEPGLSHARFLEQLCPLAVVGPGVERPPGGTGEHEPVFFPQIAGGVALAPLGGLMFGE
jgi:hypothetical protein